MGCQARWLAFNPQQSRILSTTCMHSACQQRFGINRILLAKRICGINANQYCKPGTVKGWQENSKWASTVQRQSTIRPAHTHTLASEKVLLLRGATGLMNIYLMTTKWTFGHLRPAQTCARLIWTASIWLYQQNETTSARMGWFLMLGWCREQSIRLECKQNRIAWGAMSKCGL